MSRRAVIRDDKITENIYDKLIAKVCENLEDIYNIKQEEIIRILLPLKISNTTMARVVNDLIPEMKATSGSIASMIYNMQSRKQDRLLDELLKELE